MNTQLKHCQLCAAHRLWSCHSLTDPVQQLQHRVVCSAQEWHFQYTTDHPILQLWDKISHAVTASTS